MALSQSALRAQSISRGIAERATPEPEGLVGIGITIQAAPRQTIVLEGDPCSHCFRVLTGTVCLYKATIDGRRQLIDFLVAGDCFGLLGVRYTYSVEAITPLKLHRFPLEPLTSMLRGNPELQFKVLCRVTQALRESQHRAAISARRGVAGRVAMLLLSMDESQSPARRKRSAISVPLSAVDIGEFVGATAPDVTKSFRDLERQGVLAREGRTQIRIVDRKRFESLAGLQSGI